MLPSDPITDDERVDQEPDVEVMRRLQRGEDLALNELMRRYHISVVAFILRYVGNHADAIDLAQETFVRVYEGRSGYRQTAKFSTWLFTIAANLCRNLARWRERHPTVSLDAPTDEDGPGLGSVIPALAESPSDSAERNDLASAVREHIHTLPHDLKTAVILFEYEELSYEEIGEIVGCSPKAVETRLYRARKLLREALSRWHSE